MVANQEYLTNFLKGLLFLCPEASAASSKNIMNMDWTDDGRFYTESDGNSFDNYSIGHTYCITIISNELHYQIMSYLYGCFQK